MLVGRSVGRSVGWSVKKMSKNVKKLSKMSRYVKKSCQKVGREMLVNEKFQNCQKCQKCPKNVKQERLKSNIKLEVCVVKNMCS